ncbi:hypothetical protein QPD78_04380 [Clostridioides difficile]|nr:hypothetical protein [Clostridioides difficile]HBF0400292.1 hypothetical protein [Clostridioides difficile]
MLIGLESFRLTIWNVNNIVTTFSFFVSVRFRLTIWNVNSSFTFATCMFLRPGFRLTIWNVNIKPQDWKAPYMDMF